MDSPDWREIDAKTYIAIVATAQYDLCNALNEQASNRKQLEFWTAVKVWGKRAFVAALFGAAGYMIRFW